MPAVLDSTAYVTDVTNKANEYAGRSNDQYKWAQDEFAKNRGVTDKVVNRALDTGANFGKYSAADRAQYEKNVMPAMDQQMDFARGYTSPERMAANRASAIGGSNMAFDTGADSMKRNLLSYGVNPASGSFAGLSEALAAKRGASGAGAGTKSNRDTEMMGQQLLNNAINTQKGLADQSSRETGVDLAAGNQAVNAGLATTQSGSQTMGTPIQWASLSDDMRKQWLAAMKASSDVTLAQEKIDAGGSSGTGAAIGAGAGILGSLAKMYMSGGMGGGAAGGAGGGTINNISSPLASGGYADLGSGSGSYEGTPNFTGMKRGGRVRRYAGGGLVDLMGGGGGGGMGGDGGGIPWMGFAQDAYGIGSEIGGGDQGLTESPQTPYDPGASFWDSVSGHPREQYDEGERTGAAIGRPIGRAVGEYFTPGFGGVWAEGAGRIGGGVGAAVQGHFGEGWNDVTQGTPLTFIHFDKGGSVDSQHDMDLTDYYNTELTPEEEAQYQQWAAQHGRQNDTYDYDMRGAWKDGIQADQNGHFPDTYKKPNHPTFSQESQYHGAEGQMGGRWDADETGSQTLQPYDQRFDPQALEHQVRQGEREQGPQIMHNPADEFAHPSYQQLADDRAWRRARARTAPRYAEGGDITSGVTDDEQAEGEASNPNMVPPSASPSGGANTDDVHAMVSVDEFVMPKDVSKWYGEKYLQGLIEKARRDMSMATAQPEPSNVPPQAMAMHPPSFRSEGARG